MDYPSMDELTQVWIISRHWEEEGIFYQEESSKGLARAVSQWTYFPKSLTFSVRYKVVHIPLIALIIGSVVLLLLLKQKVT
jgi:hypothetical protein